MMNLRTMVAALALCLTPVIAFGADAAPAKAQASSTATVKRTSTKKVTHHARAAKRVEAKKAQ